MTSAVTGYQIHTLLIIQQPAKYAFLSFELQKCLGVALGHPFFLGGGILTTEWSKGVDLAGK